MVSKKTQSEKISSEKKSIGFDFQYYFFLWKLLSLKEGESVGLEVKDDVHTELDNDFHIYYQVKHTTQKNVLPRHHETKKKCSSRVRARLGPSRHALLPSSFRFSSLTSRTGSPLRPSLRLSLR